VAFFYSDATPAEPEVRTPVGGIPTGGPTIEVTAHLRFAQALLFTACLVAGNWWKRMRVYIYEIKIVLFVLQEGSSFLMG
jgi:hypothetical protein